jgi:hypothetical protein
MDINGEQLMVVFGEGVGVHIVPELQNLVFNTYLKLPPTTIPWPRKEALFGSASKSEIPRLQPVGSVVKGITGKLDIQAYSWEQAVPIAPVSLLKPQQIIMPWPKKEVLSGLGQRRLMPQPQPGGDASKATSGKPDILP